MDWPVEWETKRGMFEVRRLWEINNSVFCSKNKKKKKHEKEKGFFSFGIDMCCSICRILRIGREFGTLYFSPAGNSYLDQNYVQRIGCWPFQTNGGVGER